MRTSSCCVTAVTKAATLTVTNPRSPVSQRETGTARPAYPRYQRRFYNPLVSESSNFNDQDLFFKISFLGHYLYLDCTEMEAMRQEIKIIYNICFNIFITFLSTAGILHFIVFSLTLSAAWI